MKVWLGPTPSQAQTALNGFLEAEGCMEDMNERLENNSKMSEEEATASGVRVKIPTQHLTFVREYLQDMVQQHHMIESGKRFTAPLIQALQQGLPQPNDTHFWSQLVDILELPWFRRRWVVQEVVLITNILVMFGYRAAPLEDFEHLVLCLTQAAFPNSHNLGHLAIRLMIGERVAGFWSMTRINEVGQSFTNHGRSELKDLLEQCRPQHATDPRDVIYGVLAMSSDALDSSMPEPDYDLPVETVYKKYAQYLFSQTPSRNPLTRR